MIQLSGLYSQTCQPETIIIKALLQLMQSGPGAKQIVHGRPC